MKPELYMRQEKDAVDLFAAFLNVTSMEATEKNFNKLRKEIDRARKRIMKEVKMKKMQGVSVVRHPFFQKRGSYDGEKMVVALRIQAKDPEAYEQIVRFAKRLGFKEKSMSMVAGYYDMESDIKGKDILGRWNVIARGTNNRGTIEEFEIERPSTHDSMSHVVGRKVAGGKQMVAGNKEYVIWGIPEGQSSETVLLARIQGEPITSMSDARKYKDVLEKKYGARKTRIQTIDMEGEFDWLKSTGLRASEGREKLAGELLKLAKSIVSVGINDLEVGDTVHLVVEARRTYAENTAPSGRQIKQAVQITRIDPKAHFVRNKRGKTGRLYIRNGVPFDLTLGKRQYDVVKLVKIEALKMKRGDRIKYIDSSLPHGMTFDKVQKASGNKVVTKKGETYDKDELHWDGFSWTNEKR